MAEEQQRLPAFMESDEVAFELGLSVRTVETRSMEGFIPGYVRIFGRHPRWQRTVILKWIQDGCPDFQAGGAYGAIVSKTCGQPTEIV